MVRWRNSDIPQTELTISTETFVRVILLVIATVVLLSILRHVTHALILLFSAFFLALALNAPVAWVAHHLPGKRRGNRALGTSIAFLIVIVLLGAFIASIVPPLIRQTDNFVNAAPHLLSDIRSQHGTAGEIIRRFHLEKQVNNLSNQLSERLRNSGGTAYSAARHIGSSIFSMLTILVLTFMMLVEGPRRLEFLHELVPKPRQPIVRRLSDDMYRVVKGYVNGQVTLAALAAVLISPALFILHIGYPVALIVIIFVCGLIPMIGHTIGAIIVTVVALFHSTTAAVIVLLYYLLYQQLENYLIQPRIQANSTNMSPLLVFAAVVVGVSFGGLFGGLVAIPLAGCLRVALLEYLRAQHMIGAPVVKEVINSATDSTK